MCLIFLTSLMHLMQTRSRLVSLLVMLLTRLLLVWDWSHLVHCLSRKNRLLLQCCCQSQHSAAACTASCCYCPPELAAEPVSCELNKRQCSVKSNVVHHHHAHLSNWHLSNCYSNHHSFCPCTSLVLLLLHHISLLFNVLEFKIK